MLANTSWHHWGDTKTVTAVLLQGMREVDFAWKPTFLKLFCDLQLYCSKTNNWFSQVPPTTFCMGVMRSRVTWATGYLSEEAEGSEQGSPGGCWLCVDWTSLQESQSQAYRAKRGLSDYGEWKRRVDTTDDSGPTEQICRSVWDWLLFTVHVPSSVSVKINSSCQTSIFWKMFLSPTPSSPPLLPLAHQVLNSTILQQVFVVEYVVHSQMCEECHHRQAQDFWRAVVQARQKVGCNWYLQLQIISCDAKPVHEIKLLPVSPPSFTSSHLSPFCLFSIWLLLSSNLTCPSPHLTLLLLPLWQLPLPPANLPLFSRQLTRRHFSTLSSWFWSTELTLMP